MKELFEPCPLCTDSIPDIKTFRKCHHCMREYHFHCAHTVQEDDRIYLEKKWWLCKDCVSDIIIIDLSMSTQFIRSYFDFHGRAKELAKAWNSHATSGGYHVVYAYYDMSGIGKTSLFVAASKIANVNIKIENVSNGSLLHKAKLSATKAVTSDPEQYSDWESR